ncbi:unnamed protein product [Phytophthora fragariaefolia]|uniref:Unnamed protein product n=1 Tax=Phytophthora fragariaefolia TaxID=1490495 RepID=A0A9W6Y6G2_9STRA|nr:unnamed protein product [Phytophthora fragariaefolia]
MNVAASTKDSGVVSYTTRSTAEQYNRPVIWWSYRGQFLRATSRHEHLQELWQPTYGCMLVACDNDDPAAIESSERTTDARDECCAAGAPSAMERASVVAGHQQLTTIAAAVQATAASGGQHGPTRRVQLVDDPHERDDNERGRHDGGRRSARRYAVESEPDPSGDGASGACDSPSEAARGASASDLSH